MEHKRRTATAIPVVSLDRPDIDLLRYACVDVGFFYLDDHGVSPDLLRRVLSESKLLFELPRDEKEQLCDKSLSRGYTAMGEETLDPTLQRIRGDTKEGYYIGRDVAKSSPKYDPSKLCGPNVWPDPAKLPHFRSAMEQYHREASLVGFRLVRLLAAAIGQHDGDGTCFFDDAFKEPVATIRLLHYAAETSEPEKGIFACGAHSDYGMLTLLLTDDTPGLQILTKDDEWMDVPPLSGCYIVNLGDMLERWTNGLFKATRHRVLTAGDRERYSVPFFYDPSFDTLVECLDVCCSRDNPPKYPPTTSGRHLFDKYLQTHADFAPRSESTGGHNVTR